MMFYILHVWFYYFPLFRIAYAFLCVSRNVVRLYLQLFVGWFISYLRFYLCICLRIVVAHIVLCVCFGFRCLVYTILPVSLDCPFLIAPSIFSSVYVCTMFGRKQRIYILDVFWQYKGQ